MADKSSMKLSPAQVCSLNKGKRKQVVMGEWKDFKRKSLKEAGKAYNSRKGVEVQAVNPPNQVRGIRV
jgi:hypothetical protein